MDYRRAVKFALCVATGAAWAQDPAATLEKARNKMLAEVPQLPSSVCIETIDRSYFTPKNPPISPSCERLGLDSKKDRTRLKLIATDRVRVAVSVAQGREVYSWTGAPPFSLDVQDVLRSGPFSTGSYATYLLDIFNNPSVRFRLLDETPTALDYGFRVPIEASRFVVLAVNEWMTAGYSGSLSIDRDSLEIRRFTIETDQLPPQTSGCELSATLHFETPRTAGKNWLLPSQSLSHYILRDATESESVTTLSDCRDSAPIPPPHPSPHGEPLPPGLDVTLAFTAPIDTDVAAAGDAISATVMRPILKGAMILVPAGATATGRIVRMKHQRDPPLFRISVVFDTLETNGVISPFSVRLSRPAALPVASRIADWQGALIFPTRDQHYVIPAGYKSDWLTAGK